MNEPMKKDNLIKRPFSSVSFFFLTCNVRLIETHYAQV